jgi:hypothetical protein
MSFNKNPGLWIVILLVVRVQPLRHLRPADRDAAAEHRDPQLGAGGVRHRRIIGAVMQLVQQQKKREGA